MKAALKTCRKVVGGHREDEKSYVVTNAGQCGEEKVRHGGKDRTDGHRLENSQTPNTLETVAISSLVKPVSE